MYICVHNINDMAQARFYLQKRSGKDKNLPVYLKYTYGKGKRIEYYTRLHADTVHYIQKYYAKGKDPFKGAAEPVNAKLKALLNHLSDIETRASLDQIELTNDYLKTELDKIWKPGSEQAEPDQIDFFGMFKKYAEEGKFSDGRRKHIKSTMKHWQDFDKKITFETFNVDLLKKFEKALLAQKKKNLKTDTIVAARGMNTISAMMKVTRAFWNHCIKEFENKGIMLPYPFKSYKVPGELYIARPVYITSDERDALLTKDLKSDKLSHIRDIFVFQCLIGSRVGDMIKLTKDNVTDGVLTYMMEKTRNSKPTVIEIPLSDQALKILSQYNEPDGRLLPFISPQKYNDYIKELFEAAGLIRIVTWMNPKTRIEERKRICEIASSHMGRRAFVGNLYGKVDSGIIGSMSGHAPNSSSFTRYRDVSRELKENAIKMLNNK